jgi:uncharacterized protein YbcV (DUF1398 family)
MKMFTLSQINEAHSKVKSGKEFPDYVKDLTNLGVTKFDAYVSDGHARYFGEGEYTIISDPIYEAMNVKEQGDPVKFSHFLKIYQQGETDYPTFCRHATETGVEKWTVDMSRKTCTYYDKKGNEMLTEEIV